MKLKDLFATFSSSLLLFVAFVSVCAVCVCTHRKCANEQARSLRYDGGSRSDHKYTRVVLLSSPSIVRSESSHASRNIGFSNNNHCRAALV
jgi:archaellum component FlaG (FlaF/FlaG flagellin family)